MSMPISLCTGERRARSITGAALLAILAGCGGDDPSEPAPAPTTTLELFVQPSSLELSPGAMHVVDVGVNRVGPYRGPVTLEWQGLPAGVTTRVLSASGDASFTGISLEMRLAPTAALGQFRPTVSARGDDTVVPASQSIFLWVVATPDFRVVLSAGTLGVAQGGTGSVTVTLTRTTFEGVVDLSLDGAPAEVTATFTPSTVWREPSTLAITVGERVSPGSYPLVVRGVAPGSGFPTDRTAALTLIVTPRE